MNNFNHWPVPLSIAVIDFLLIELVPIKVPATIVRYDIAIMAKIVSQGI